MTRNLQEDKNGGMHKISSLTRKKSKGKKKSCENMFDIEGFMQIPDCLIQMEKYLTQ